MYCGYRPLINFTPQTIVNSGTSQMCIPYSQWPHVWLNPQQNQGAEMELPFFWHRNYLNALSAQEMTDMGLLSFINFTTLQSANGVSGEGVTISVYAWAEDVLLSGPTTALATQGHALELQGDEYGNGPISGPATAISKAAGFLSNLPVIGRFATATQIGASAVSSIAKLFGFTNVPVIADPLPFRPEPFPKFASTEIGHPIEKLSLDSKNELTIDPMAIGLKAEDEMAITNLVTRESYLCSATWTTSQAVDTIIFSARAQPMLQDYIVLTNYTEVFQTPMAWISSMFKYWRGDIIFKFKIVASPYHKGRLRISFDPTGTSTTNILNTTATTNTVFTEVVDLGDTNEVEVRLPYQQALPFLQCASNTAGSNAWSTSSSPTYAHNPDFDNGTIAVRVQTLLTAPVASSSVSVLVFVRGAENLEFADPVELNPFSTFTVQGDSQPVVQTVAGDSPPSVNETRNLVHFGERMLSLRKLLRRYTMVGADYLPAPTTSDYICVFQRDLTKVPPMAGYDPNGIYVAASVTSPGFNHAYSYTQPHPFNWVAPAFLAYRGSMNWSFNIDANAPAAHFVAARAPGAATVASQFTVKGQQGSGTTANKIVNTALLAQPGAAGMALINQRTNAGLNVQVPMYTNHRFCSTNPANSTAPSTVDGSVLDMFRLELITDATSTGFASSLVWSYAAIGTDFGLHFFANVPTWFQYTNPPTPV